MSPPPTLHQCILEQLEVLSERLKPAPFASYRSNVRNFLRYLQQNHPEVETPAQLRRDPHILGWLKSLVQRSPPYANGSRMRMMVNVRRLLNDLADNRHPVAENLFVHSDIPYPPRPVRPEVDSLLGRLVRQQIATLSLTLRPGTIGYYRSDTKAFLLYLQRNHPEVETPAQLRRDPHILGWLKSLAQRSPPYTNDSRMHTMVHVRRLLNDLADNGHPVAENLIVSRDFPPRDLYLPRPVSPEVDTLLKEELRKTDDLLSNALLLIRATGVRLGECLGLKRNCLHHLGSDHWAIHVPLGKLHNERLVPIDEEGRRALDRILSLTEPSIDSSSPLIAMKKGKKLYPDRIRKALAEASTRAGCQPVRPHQLRHTYATTMLRAGISLPALKEILGHRDIKMTLRYVAVTQADLQREYLLARQKMATIHTLPRLPGSGQSEKEFGIPAICNSMDAIRHQLEMFRRQLSDQETDHKIRILLKRFHQIRSSLAALSDV